MTVTDKKIKLKRASYPEKAGVSSREIEALINEFKEKNIEVHSIMIMRNGKVAFESWAAPYSADIPHSMYSVSKTVTCTAIGFAIEEGLLSLETKLIDIFPEYAPEKPDANLEKLTIHNLLSMQSGKSVSVFSDKTKGKWIKQFFDSPWGFTPGDGHWEYISENQYMLCAVLTRITNMSVVDYLMPRLFEPLGIDRPFWETDPDNGIEAGGWGLFIKTEDLAKITTCYQHEGKLYSKQIIPAQWVKKVLKIYASNAFVNKQPDSQCGYGYCVWKCAGANAFRLDGMFSQFGIVFNDIDASFIMTCGEIDEQRVRDCIWNHVPKCFIEPDSEPKADHKICLAPLSDNMPVSERYQQTEESIAGNTYAFEPNHILDIAGFPVSMLPLPVVYMSADKAGNITNVSFDFYENECTMTWDEGNEHNTITCGMDGIARNTPIHLGGIDFTAVSTAAWIDENKLEIHMRPVESICQRRITFIFNDKKISFIPRSQMTMDAMAENLSHDVDNYVNGVLLQRLGLVAFDQLPKICEPTYHGKLINE